MSGLLLSASGLAQGAKASAQGQRAVVGPEGATVYQRADFDSPVQAQLPPGTAIVISRKAQSGAGGLGVFYRVRVGKTLGFVVDTDVIPQFTKRATNPGTRPKVQENPNFQEVEQARERQRLKLEPVYFTRYFGGSLGMVNYSEKFAGQTLNANTMLYGLRVTGPGWLLESIPLDWNLLFSPKAPEFYDKLSPVPASGFMMMTDMGLQFPFAEWDDALVYYGLGAMLAYSKVRVQYNLEFFDSQELRLGATGVLGMAYRQKRWVARFDAKYHFEVTSYLGFQLSLQHQY